MCHGWPTLDGRSPCVHDARFVRVLAHARAQFDEGVVNLFEKAKQVLEWPRLLEALALHAQSAMGTERCGALALSADVIGAQRHQQETSEMRQLQESSDPLPTLLFSDIREPLARAQKGAILEAHELRDSAVVLRLGVAVHGVLGRHRLEAPMLADVAAPLRTGWELAHLRASLEAAIHDDGSIKESATPELKRLSRHAHDLKQQMRHHLEQILHSHRYTEVLQEQYFAQREGRYVVPVKADMRGRVSGIVHDISASGATVFLEPRELVELNNSIKVADLEVEREVRRILRELTELVAEQAGAMLAAVDALAELDCISAKASFGRQLKAYPVGLNDAGRVLLKKAKHPLLLLSKNNVVANEILLDETIRVLVISGPNTGGKTVTLKIVGLFALMARAGLHLPCEPESDMAIFLDLYADIGDAQDLTRDLSSFSAHMTQIIQLLAETDSAGTTGRALVLLDEPVTSTDPAEGAALAEALLCRLASLNMKVVATTHYGSLKALAQTTAGFANAAVEFDVIALAPTYRLFMGIPGGSSALEIAARLGMDRALLDDARQRLKKEDRTLEDLLVDLHHKQRRLMEDIDQAAKARADAEQAAHVARERLARLEITEREERKGIKKKLSEQFSRARTEVQATVDALKREQKLIKAKESKQRLIELEAQTRAELGPAVTPIPLDQLVVGDQVEISGLGMTGTLLEVPWGKKRVRIRVGEGEILATVANLVGIGRGSARVVEPVPPVGPPRPVASSLPFGDEHTLVDVRGQAADEALDHVIAALDRATLTNAPFLRIIHGHGTGKLKATLREYLKASPYVVKSRPGDRTEGGDGVTVADLRRD
jgi:DNA mismatch repair protein MutS2